MRANFTSKKVLYIAHQGFKTPWRQSNTVTINKIPVEKTIKQVETLLKEDKTLSPQMRAMVELLLVIVSLLVARLGLNSQNSSTPPSKDPRRPRGSKRKVPGEKRQAGGQKGHPGKTLKKFEAPDTIETLEIDRRTLPSGKRYTQIGFEARQVVDIEITRRITEYRAEIVQDEDGRQFVAAFPPAVTRPIQYGASVKAQAVYMSQQQLIPYDRIREYFAGQCGIPVSAGSLFTFNQEAYDLLETSEEIIRGQLIASDVLHVDETGINVNGKTSWLHTAGNGGWTLYFPHERRGRVAMEAMGVLAHFRGTLCHDHWKPYFGFQLCRHALCNAHHLRELERAWEQDNQAWARAMQSLLCEINDAVTGAGGVLPAEAAEVFRGRYRKLLVMGDKECREPPDVAKSLLAADGGKKKRGRKAKSKARNLLERLRNFETETLRFMNDLDVPFTNNQGENDIRMTKVQQKISGCFRSTEGAAIFCRVRSYLSTCRKQGLAAPEALSLLFSGRLPKFLETLM